MATAISAENVDPVKMVDSFEAAGGKFEGYRRSGAKGICATAEFVGSTEGRALSSASVFSGQKIPVIVRFSVGGGNPKAVDNAKSQRNMALQFNLSGGETWQMGNISAPVFGSSTPAQLLGRLESLTPDPSTKAPNPEKVKAFAEANPEVLLQGKYFASQPVPASFASVNYWGVNAFAFVNSKGEKQFGKWIFEPATGVLGLHTVHHQGHLPACAQGLAMLGEGVGRGLQAMVDVHRPDLPRPALGASDQHGAGVGPTAQGHHQGRQVVQGLHGLGQRVLGWGGAGAHPGLIGLQLWCRCSGRNFAVARNACRAAL